MSETIGVNVLRRAKNMEVSPQFDGYSGVRIFIGTDDNGDAIVIESGDTNGRTLEIKNPFGTQEMADNILADINGYQYQPMSAEAAQLNPAAEMGDGVTVNGVYSGIFVRATQFGRLMASDIAAPTDEEIEHEFAVESASDRQYTRFVQQTKGMLRVTNLAIEAEVSARTAADEQMSATLQLHASQIAAKVSQTGGNNSSFGWTLTSTGHTWYSNNQQVMKITSSGLEVKGKIQADSGYIGGANGFVITANKIYKNISQFGGTQSTGVYIGTDGIQLGKNFKVDSSGNLTAASGTFTGTVSAGNIAYGGNNGYFNGGGLSSGTVGTGQLSSYAAGGVGGGVNYNNASKRGGSYPVYFEASTLCASSSLSVGGKSLTPDTLAMPNGCQIYIDGHYYTGTLTYGGNSRKIWSY